MSDNELEIESGENKKWTEIELLTIPLCDSEAKNIPLGINAPFVKYWWAFYYAFSGHYWVLKHALYKFFYLECGICWSVCFFTYFIFPMIWVTLCTVFPPLVAVTIAYPAAWWVNDTIINFFFARSMKRASYVEEHYMKGSKFSFGSTAGVDSGKKGGIMAIIQKILVLVFIFALKKIAKDAILAIVLFITLILTVISGGWALIVMIPICWYVLVLQMGFNAFTSGFLNRKEGSFLGKYMWCYYQNHFIVFSYGLASSIIYLIPGMQVTHYFVGAIGATRYCVHLEHKKGGSLST